MRKLLQLYSLEHILHSAQPYCSTYSVGNGEIVIWVSALGLSNTNSKIAKYVKYENNSRMSALFWILFPK